jgi:hypothetical protein
MLVFKYEILRLPHLCIGVYAKTWSGQQFSRLYKVADVRFEILSVATSYLASKVGTLYDAAMR